MLYNSKNWAIVCISKKELNKPKIQKNIKNKARNLFKLDLTTKSFQNKAIKDKITSNIRNVFEL